MTQTTTETVEEPAPPPPTTKTPPTTPAPGMTGVPGVPLAVAGANTLSLAAVGASALAGPVGLVALGAAGLVAGGGMAVRAARRRTTAPATGHRSHAGGGAAASRTSTPATRSATSAAGNRGTTTTAGRAKVSGVSRFGSGKANRPNTTGTHTGAAGTSRTTGASAGTGQVPAPFLRGRGKSTPVNLSKTHHPHTSTSTGAGGRGRAARAAAGGRNLAAGAIARRQGKSPVREARAAAKSAGRTAKGVAKAERRMGAPSTTGGTRGRGAKPVLASAVQAKALRRSALRHGARMAGAALLAGGVGLVSGLWNIKHPGKAAGHMRTVWRRLAGRARKVRAERDARITGQAGPGKTRIPAERVSDPNRRHSGTKVPAGVAGRAARLLLGKTTTPDAPSTGGTVSDPATVPGTFSRLSEAADVMLQAASTFDPEHMSQFQVLIDDLPDAMQIVQETLRVLAELSDERLPVDRRVVEEIGEGYRAMSRVVDSLEEVGTVYRRVHAEDIERNENPRNGLDGERRWNV
ncbi:hypothetical protein POF50_021445 [Streptomyces sp. SL13]|uniref:Uncharacterized protein n=1 Tax=Streptantibioticus silvisoli TaxID=2705255 RepID=A0AA90H619_9ACTN|nr:hypothetical protein [Streptantibioticus silvisoli]MDI5971866.1 hypothetical protein [Streptantibioticus silvisoli]